MRSNKRGTNSRWKPHNGLRNRSVELKERIRSRRAKIGVIGLGYVGLPLAVEFALEGFDVTGFDVDAWKVAEINAGRSYIGDVKTKDVASTVADGHLRATTARSRRSSAARTRSAPSWPPISTDRSSTRWCRSARRRWPRWSSCSRTPSVR